MVSIGCKSNCPSWRFPATCGHVNPLLKREPSRRSRLGSFSLTHPMTKPPATPSPHPYLDALAERVLVYDGAMGTNIQRYNLTPEDFGGKALEGCNDNLVLTRPDVIQAIHESFLAVGCDVRGDVHVPVDAAPARGVGARRQGARHQRRGGAAGARRVRQVRDARPPALRRRLDRPDGDAAVEQRSRRSRTSPSTSSPRTYYQQAKYLVEGGVDVLLVETAQDILEVKAALAGFERLFAELGRRVPVQAQVTLDTSGRMLLGTDIASAHDDARVAARGRDRPELLDGPGAHARAGALPDASTRRVPISCIPNAGLPLNTGTGEAVYPLEPEPMAAMLARVRARVRRAHRRRLLRHDARAPRRRSSARGARRASASSSRRGTSPVRRERARVPRVSSAMRAITLHQDPPPLLVGERVNSQGSRKVKRLLLADDYEGILDVAREQVESGAHVLDVCVALTERADEAEQMAKVVKLLSMSVETPLMIDSTEAPVIEAALRARPRPRDRQLHQHGERPQAHRRGGAAREEARRGARRAHDRRGRDGEDARAQARGRARDPRHRRRRVRPRARRPDLRRAHVHARHRRRGVDRLARTRRSRASGSSSASCPASSRSSASRT